MEETQVLVEARFRLPISIDQQPVIGLNEDESRDARVLLAEDNLAFPCGRPAPVVFFALGLLLTCLSESCHTHRCSLSSRPELRHC